MNSVLVDTSFLISLSTDTRAEHAVARQYFRSFIERKVTMFLSTIVVCEYEVRQPISDIGLHNFIVLPFNFDHALTGATLFTHMFAARSDSGSRVALKDDVKLAAQAVSAGISHFVTSDRQCSSRLDTVRHSAALPGLPFCIHIADPYSDAWFNAGNQVALPFSSPLMPSKFDGG